jgi:hypothetical protein
VSIDARCPRQDPHPSHFRREEGWKPRHTGDKHFWCAGVADPAIQALSDEQLELAAREQKKREEAARKARQDEQFRRYQVAEGELNLRYRKDLVGLLAEHGWQRIPGPENDRKLLEAVYDLMCDYREARDDL